MSEIIKKFTIAGASDDTRDIGAEAQNVIVSYDDNGNVIEDITVTTPDSTGSLAEDLNNRAIKNHASTTSEYGAASNSEYGHIKLGTGLEVDAESGATRVKYGTGIGTAAAGNDIRLSDKRVARNAVTFTDGSVTKIYDGSTAQTVSYNDVGAAKKNHASNTVEYGAASKNNFGHVKVGEGIEVTSGVISVKASGGSTIHIFTPETDLYGREVTVTAESGETATARFDNSGYAIMKGFAGTGTIYFRSQGSSLSAEGSMNIPYFGNYSITLAFWSASVTITTPTVDMFGKTVVVKKDDLEVGTTIFDGSGVANYSVHSSGTYVFECTIGWKTFKNSAIIELEQEYNVVIEGFVSNITITTTTPEFAGAYITVSGGEDVPGSTIVFGPDNSASYKAYEPGTYTFAVIYQGESYPKNVTVAAQIDYTTAIDLWTAIVNLTTEDFANQTGQIYDDNEVFMGNFTFDGNGQAIYRAHKPGIYVFSITEEE